MLLILANEKKTLEEIVFKIEKYLHLNKYVFPCYQVVALGSIT